MIRRHDAIAIGIEEGEGDMLGWAITFLLVALLAGFLGMSGVAGTAAWMAHVLFVVFLVLFLLSLLSGRRIGPPLD